eukprot:Skav223048  [mRNA]  locus=scaffold1069:249861:250082:+ [translate_table: standard]
MLPLPAPWALGHHGSLGCHPWPLWQCRGLVKSLLMAFAPLDQRDATSEGDQALHLAVKAGHLHVVKMLVEARP